MTAINEMGHVLHDWDLARKKLLLAKAFAALPKGGAIIVYDAIIDDDRRKNAFGLLMSLNMLIETPGGFDYTGADYVAWMLQAGFTATRSSISLARIVWSSASSRDACHLQAASIPDTGFVIQHRSVSNYEVTMC